MKSITVAFFLFFGLAPLPPALLSWQPSIGRHLNSFVLMSSLANSFWILYGAGLLSHVATSVKHAEAPSSYAKPEYIPRFIASSYKAHFVSTSAS